ncbi:MAG: DUF4349 domain-containing protein [Solirubrobacterales bacterium]
MGPFEDDQLLATLESLRPEPRPEFAAELDERAAAGFPPPERGASPWRRLRARLAAARPRRLLLTGGAVALTAVIVATAVVAGSGGGGGSGSNTVNQSAGTLGDLNAFDESAGAAAASPSAGSGAGGGETVLEAEESTVPSAGAASSRGTAGESGPYASGAKHRAVERGAEITLGTDPGEVGKAAGKVLEAVHSYDGIVLDSSVSGGSEGEAGARFTLLIPSAKLPDALAAFSEIAEVRSRHESSNDITAPTVTIGERLQDSHARVQSLLGQLEDAETEAEQEAVEAKLAAERRQQARLKSQLSSLRRRANLSRVSLRIVSDEAPAGGAGGGWDAGSALHDAGHILSVAAGVLIVAAAVLAPLALLVLLALLAHRVWLRGRRERALG